MSGAVVDCTSETCAGQDGLYTAGCPPEGRFIDKGELLFVVNFDVLYELTAQKVEPYVGGGLFWSRRSVAGTSRSDIGLNLKGGVVFSPPGKLRPFAEGVIRVEGGSSLLLKGGLLFAFGR